MILSITHRRISLRNSTQSEFRPQHLFTKLDQSLTVVNTVSWWNLCGHKLPLESILFIAKCRCALAHFTYSIESVFKISYELDSHISRFSVVYVNNKFVSISKFRNWKKARAKSKNCSLQSVIFRTFWKDYAFVGLLYFCSDIFFRLGQPFLLGYLLDYFR